MMNCNKQYTIKVTEGNAFGLLLQLKSRTFRSSEPIDENIDATQLQDIVIKINGTEFTDFTADEDGVLLNIPEDKPVGTYNVELAATYYGVEIRAAYYECFSIVPWSYQSDAINYIPGSPISAEAAYLVVGVISDQELEELKAEYRRKIAAAEAAEEAAEAAKEAYDEKAEALDDIAQQTTLTAVQDKIGTPATGQAPTLFQAIAEAGGGQFPTDYAKQGNNASATLTATQTAATNAASYAETAKNAVVDGNDTAISVSKEIRSEVGTGSDTAAESGTLFAILKWVKDKVKSIFNLIGSPASGQPSTLFAAIAAGGGGGGDAQESTSQEILAQVNQIVSANILSASIDGFTFQSGQAPATNKLGDIISHFDNVVSIIDNSVTIFDSIVAGVVCGNMPYLMSATFNAVTRVEGANAQIGGQVVGQVFNFPNATVAALNTRAFQSNATIKELHMPNVTTFTQQSTVSLSSGNLIDIELGAINQSFVISSWNPLNALSSSSSSLIDPGETFANNLEKFLYNVRNHIASNLPDRTGLAALTITFHANVKAAINADTATANAFTNKNWTIA